MLSIWNLCGEITREKVDGKKGYFYFGKSSLVSEESSITTSLRDVKHINVSTF